MANRSPIIAAGSPGEVWRNETDKIAWQFICSLSNSCGQCVQFHLQIGKYWPIPLHRGCKCRQDPVAVGAEAQPFVDFRQVIRDASPDQRAKFVGKSNLRLIESGVVKWEDVVTPARIRTLHEVVGKSKLTVADLKRGGLSKARASLAYASAHPEEESTARRSAKALAGFLDAQGVSRETAKKAVAATIASRAGVTGPSGAKRVAIPLPPLPSLKAIRPPGVSVAVAQVAGTKVAPIAVESPKLPPLGPSRAAVDVHPNDTVLGVKGKLAEIFGRPVSLKEVPSLIGAPDAAMVEIAWLGKDELEITAEGGGVQMNRGIGVKNGKVYINNFSFEVDEEARGKGLGTKVFAKQVENAVRMGVDHIETEAMRARGKNGYYTWPRLGYDGELKGRMMDALPPTLAGAEKVSDLMKTEEGRAWWKENGDTLPLKFDLTEGSQSRAVLDSYRAEKEKAD